jgi:hypothetical protein
MQITRSGVATAKGPAAWFTGDVYIDVVAAAAPRSRSATNLASWPAHALTPEEYAAAPSVD